MKDQRLSELNFREILDYGGQPPVRHRYETPLTCHGFCIDCETKGLIDRAGDGQLDLMSHGCDTADFETVLGPMPHDGPGVQQPVLFLLEIPGGDWESGPETTFSGHCKRPPRNHYYWTPNTDSWPSSAAEFFNSWFYGEYFAYLMRRHQLMNVYITNLIKCKWTTSGNTPDPILKNCTELYLRRETLFFRPQLVFCFGRRAQQGFGLLGFDISTEYLRHPSLIRNRPQTLGKTREQLVEENDERVQSALAALDKRRRV